MQLSGQPICSWAGKKALVIGYGDVGKGSAQSLRQEGMIVRVTEIDPICAMQACMDGYEVVSPYINGINTGKVEDIDLRLMAGTDMIVTCTGNVNVCDANLLSTVSSNAVVCNIGHFDTEIDTQYMRDNWRWQEVKPQVHKIFRSDDPTDYLLLLSEGRLVNLGQCDRSSLADYGWLFRQPGFGANVSVRTGLGPVTTQCSVNPLRLKSCPKRWMKKWRNIWSKGLAGPLPG